MRRSLLAYGIYGACLLALYGTGGFSGWWKSIVLFRGWSTGGSGSGGHGGTWGLGGGSGGGFRGGK